MGVIPEEFTIYPGQTQELEFTLKDPLPLVKRKRVVQKSLLDRAFNLKIDKFDWFAGENAVPFSPSNPATYQAGSSNQLIVVQAGGQLVETDSPISMAPSRLTISGRSSSTVPDVDVLVTLNPKEIPPASCTGTASVTVTIRVTRKETTLPVPNFKFTLLAKGVDDSGGHELNHPTATKTFKVHPTTRPVGTFSQNIATTTHEGLFTLAYTPSYFGGSETISVMTTGSQTFLGMATLTVRVPNLILLPASPALYIKYGGTARHTGPSEKPKELDSPDLPDRDNNHFGTKNFVKALEKLALDYSKIYPIASNSNPQIRYNYMSLPYGGKFDINGKWHGWGWITKEDGTKVYGDWNHSKHREGENIDFGIFKNGKNVFNATQKNKIFNLIKDVIGKEPHKEGDHWHLTFSKKRNQ